MPFVRRYLIFLPSLLTGVIGGIILLFRPLRLEAQAGVLETLLTAVLLVVGLLGGAWLLDKLLPSFRYASKMLERALAGFPISIPLALALATMSSVSEELFFRGALLPFLGVWGQALVFGLMHPAPRQAWSYTVFTFVAGVAFGYATLFTGHLWAGMLAHFVINLQGFLELRHLQQKRRKRFAPPPRPIEGQLPLARAQPFSESITDEPQDNKPESGEPDGDFDEEDGRHQGLLRRLHRYRQSRRGCKES